jgi:hypothetical protein
MAREPSRRRGSNQSVGLNDPELCFVTVSHNGWGKNVTKLFPIKRQFFKEGITN